MFLIFSCTVYEFTGLSIGIIGQMPMYFGKVMNTIA
jgi:hypothetical protein